MAAKPITRVFLQWMFTMPASHGYTCADQHPDYGIERIDTDTDSDSDADKP
jgi:hypothetical protein